MPIHFDNIKYCVVTVTYLISFYSSLLVFYLIVYFLLWAHCFCQYHFTFNNGVNLGTENRHL